MNQHNLHSTEPFFPLMTEQEQIDNLEAQVRMYQGLYEDVKEELDAIREIMQPEWIHGRVLLAYVGSESVARISAIRAVLDAD